MAELRTQHAEETQRLRQQLGTQAQASSTDRQSRLLRHGTAMQCALTLPDRLYLQAALYRVSGLCCQ